MHPYETIAFLAFVVFATWLDLFVLNKDHHEVSLKEAGITAAAWIGLAVVFSGYVYWRYGTDLWMQYLTGYALEEALSLDNLFVFAVIFASFGLDGAKQHIALTAGILGAIVLRVIMIFAGVSLIQKFSWLLPLFGVFLLYTGLKMFKPESEEETDFKEGKLYKWMTKVLPVYPGGFDGDKIMTKWNGKRAFTTLGLAILIVGPTDIMFALDSIPAVMGVSKDPFIVMTSNIFAVMGLRAIFFMLSGIMGQFRYLKYGLAFVLSFIGVKMILPLLGEHYHVPTLASLGVVLGTIALSIVASMAIPPKEGKAGH